MESLNLNTLASSLPTANLQNAEKELLNNFKAAALSITTLYRSSRRTSKRAYNTGYAAACQDLLMMIQQGVSVGGIGLSESGSHGPGMTIGKVMDWIEARLEAIKAREEEEEEDEEKERDRHKNDTAQKSDPEVVKPSTPARAPTTPGPAPQRKDRVAPSLPTPSSSSNAVITRPPEPSSPSPPPPPTTALRPIYPPNPSQRSKARTAAAASSDSKHNSDRSLLPLPNGTSIPPFSLPQFDLSSSSLPMTPYSSGMPSALPSPTLDLSAGAKRRHAVMMMLDSSSQPVPIPIPSPSGASRSNSSRETSNGVSSTHMPGAGTARRRTRSSRGAQQAQHVQHLGAGQASEAMDVEEDSGRERKRVARRGGQQ